MYSIKNKPSGKKNSKTYKFIAQIKNTNIPNHRTIAALAGWSAENIKKAIEAVNNNSLSQRQAACAFGVPKSYLNDRCTENIAEKWPRYPAYVNL